MYSWRQSSAILIGVLASGCTFCLLAAGVLVHDRYCDTAAAALLLRACVFPSYLDLYAGLWFHLQRDLS